MIVRVWGVVNSTEIEFEPMKNRPGYWQGYAPRIPGLQEIEIWAENHRGARGHLRTQVQIEWEALTRARLILTPYIVFLVPTETGCSSRC